MKKNGFSLVELLAVIVIVGIIGGIAIVSVSSNILKSRDTSFVDLAKTYMESARSMKAKDNLLYDPKTNEVVVIPCDQVNGTEIEHKDTTGYGDVLKEYCYVGIQKNKTDKYSYYMTLADDSYHMLIGKEYNTVSKDDIEIGEEKISQISSISVPLSGFNVTYADSTYVIRAIRMKYSATYDGGTKGATLSGYYTNDGTQNTSNAHLRGTISELDNFLFSTDKTVEIGDITYTINNSEILYIVAKK